MAIVATAVVTGSGILAPATPEYKSWTLTCLDADTGPLAIPHGFKTQAGAGATPDNVQLQESISVANAALANWGITVDATNINVTKQNAAGSGGAVAGTTIVAKIVARLPHSEEQ
jgi:hypothetical protein